MRNNFRRIPRKAFGDFQTTIFIKTLLSNAGSRHSRTRSAKTPLKTAAHLSERSPQSGFLLPMPPRRFPESGIRCRHVETWCCTPSLLQYIQVGLSKVQKKKATEPVRPVAFVIFCFPASPSKASVPRRAADSWRGGISESFPA